MKYTVEFSSTAGNDFLYKDGNLANLNNVVKDINDLYELCKQQHEALKSCASLLCSINMDGPTTEKADKALDQFNKLFK